MKKLLFIIAAVGLSGICFGQHSIARDWSEILLAGIRNDLARPTVHARNLYHTSVVMYDSWAVFETDASTYFLGKELHGYECLLNDFAQPGNINQAKREVMSYALAKLLKHRFLFSPGAIETWHLIDSLMESNGFDQSFDSQDYSSGSMKALGNYLGAQIIQYGLQDGANETGFYENQFYEPFNPPLIMDSAGNPNILDLNRWQPLTLDEFIDQSGNVIPGSTPDFLSPEWGSVDPFSLSPDDLTINERDGNEYWVYHDPGAPPYYNEAETKDQYKWGFSLVAAWGSHLDPADSVIWDISPASIGKNPEFPTSSADYPEFYEFENGGDQSAGHTSNPVTGMPYESQWVPRADYARALAEFWADGPDSETPPGHWFTLLNYVNDHPLLEKKIEGAGEVVDDLEWDVKSYFMLGGAMHDVAITSWGIKGWYDYIRPVSSIRGMAELGQSTDQSRSNYHEDGIPLFDGFVEVVELGDDLAGESEEHVGKIKLYTWRGPNYIEDPETSVAGVDWILAENWWPYQRPSFVTPPFAGYVSGHSTYSRAAAEILTMLTGDEFFPGGMGVFEMKKNEFLVFEDGPSVDFELQWATYRDASDQCSLSRIWGGIHPPADDIPGRIIGEKIGKQAFDYATLYFTGQMEPLSFTQSDWEGLEVYPNPVENKSQVSLRFSKSPKNLEIYLLSLSGSEIKELEYEGNGKDIQIRLNDLPGSAYLLKVVADGQIFTSQIVVQ